MPSWSVKPDPIKSRWYRKAFISGQLKEVLGSITLFHWHCGKPMRRVLEYSKTSDGVRKIGPSVLGVSSWICQICQKREYDDPDYM